MYEQKVVWIGTILEGNSIEDLEKFFLEEFGYHIKYIDKFEMVDGIYKDLNCIIFGICEKEISKFALFKLKTNDMKWWEDFVNNEKENIPCEILEKYPKMWGLEPTNDESK